MRCLGLVTEARSIGEWELEAKKGLLLHLSGDWNDEVSLSLSWRLIERREAPIEVKDIANKGDQNKLELRMKFFLIKSLVKNEGSILITLTLTGYT